MTAQASPFTTRRPVSGRDFFGRQGELSTILEGLCSGSAVNAYSLRRLGKTSLLRQVEHLCADEPLWSQFDPIVVDLMGPGRSLLGRVATRLGSTEQTLERDLKRKNRRPLVILDELAYWLRNVDEQHDLAKLRALHQSGSLNFMVSTLYGSVIDHLNQASDLESPFHNIFHVVRLPVFSEHEACDLLVTQFGRTQVPITESDALHLARYVGCSPNLLQEIGHVAWLEAVRTGHILWPDVASNWLRQYGGNWVSTILTPIRSGAVHRFGSSLGMDHQTLLLDAMQAYGAIDMRADGRPHVTPWIVDAMDGEEAAEKMMTDLLVGSESASAVDCSSIGMALERGLRMAFRDAPPTKESEVQHYVDVVLASTGVCFQKEGPTFVFSLRRYRPDHTIAKQRLVIEAKLCKNRDDLGRVIESMSADLAPYLKHYDRVLFVVFDLGAIYDVDAFGADFEEDERVEVVVIKR